MIPYRKREDEDIGGGGTDSGAPGAAADQQARVLRALQAVAPETRTFSMIVENTRLTAAQVKQALNAMFRERFPPATVNDLGPWTSRAIGLAADVAGTNPRDLIV